jgi:hypothetical protein
MNSTHKKEKPVSMQETPHPANHGKRVTGHFPDPGQLTGTIQRVNVDFAAPLLEELDRTAKELNISRQAVIKTLLRQALDQHYLATAGRNAGKHR